MMKSKIALRAWLFSLWGLGFWVLLGLFGCKKAEPQGIDFNREMRFLVQEMSAQAKGADPDFIVVMQDSPELLTKNGTTSGTLEERFLAAVDGIGVRSLHYGMVKEDARTPEDHVERVLPYFERVHEFGWPVLVTDFAFTASLVDDAYQLGAAKGFVSSVVPDWQRRTIPVYPDPIYGENARDILSLDSIRNFLPLMDPSWFTDREDYLSKLEATNYDLIIVDLFKDDQMLSAQEVDRLKFKANGARRLVLARMEVDVVDPDRYYWQSEWADNETMPDFVERKRDRNTSPRFFARFWKEGWKETLYGNTDSYLTQIVGQGFDGVYLEQVGALGYFRAEYE